MIVVRLVPAGRGSSSVAARLAAGLLDASAYTYSEGAAGVELTLDDSVPTELVEELRAKLAAAGFRVFIEITPPPAPRHARSGLPYGGTRSA